MITSPEHHDYTTRRHAEAAERWWDSEDRRSPYSVVADPDDEVCEVCEQEPVYDGPNDRYGRCGCDGLR